MSACKELRRTTEYLRSCDKFAVKLAMRQICESKNFAVSNSHLSDEELQKIAPHKDAKSSEWDPEFPDAPVFAPYAAGVRDRDRPQVRISGVGKIYCAHVAYFYKLHWMKYPEEDLTKKDAAWWNEQVPDDYEVSHRFDGVRADCNPRNLTLEPHDVNKSRAFCRLLFELLCRTQSEKDSKAAAHDTCKKLHKPSCKFLSGELATSVAAIIQTRRERAMADEKNAERQREEKRENAKGRKGKRAGSQARKKKQKDPPPSASDSSPPPSKRMKT